MKRKKPKKKNKKKKKKKTTKKPPNTLKNTTNKLATDLLPRLQAQPLKKLGGASLPNLKSTHQISSFW